MENAETHAHYNLSIKEFDYSIKNESFYVLIDQVVNSQGPKSLIAHHLDSADKFCRNGIGLIVTHGFKLNRDVYNPREHSGNPDEKNIVRINCQIIPRTIEIKKPIIHDTMTGQATDLMPNDALTREKIYSGPLSVACDIKATAYYADGHTETREEHIKDLNICKLPIIKGSIYCHTYGLPKEALLHLHEDPLDPGAIFIIRGEWAVDCTESMPYNWPKIYINEGYDKQRDRCEYISKPGDSYQNSDYFMIVFNNDDTIVVEIYREKLVGVYIPFFLLFRALGWSSDQKILDWIIYDYNNPANNVLLEHVTNAMKAKYSAKHDYFNMRDRNSALNAIVNMIAPENMKYFDLQNKPENYQNARNDILEFIDIHFMPHIGMNAESRNEKLKFLGLLIRKTILVYLGQIDQTDRVSMRNKRIHPAGDNYAKTFKSFFNHSFIRPAGRGIMKEFKSQPFDKVSLNRILAHVQDTEFERLMRQSVIGGKGANMKLSQNRTVVNRLSSIFVHRKNMLNYFSILRQISKPFTESGIQSPMATEMRKVHMSAIGYKDVVHSNPEGESVGINEQLAMSASIAPSSSSLVLRKDVMDDPDFIASNTVNPSDTLTPEEISVGQYSRIFINGELIGYVKDSPKFVSKYKQLRRDGKIHMHTTIYWDVIQNEVYLFVDSGRMTRPLLIVYNTLRDRNVFEQKSTDENIYTVYENDDEVADIADVTDDEKTGGDTADNDEEPVVEIVDIVDNDNDDLPELTAANDSSTNDNEADISALMNKILAKRAEIDTTAIYGSHTGGKPNNDNKYVDSKHNDSKHNDSKHINKNDKKHSDIKFEQGIALTNEDVKMMLMGKKTIMDLVREKKIEYITPEEQENCYLSPSFKQLKRDRYNKYRQYTHCDIPEAIVGLTALTSPFGDHNQPAKLIYQTTQAKQTCGYYALNWPFRMDKETFLQPINEKPLILTKANRYILPNGCNVLMGMMCHTGFNQEDSLIFNKTTIENGLYGGSKFTFVRADLEQRDEFGIPDKTRTDRIKSANYEKIDADGVVPKGTKITNGDVIIGCYSALPKQTDKYTHTDKSLVHDDDEDAIVHNVIKDQNEDGMKFCKVGLRKIRNPMIGDKFSSRHGQKGICALIMNESDMPYLEDGQKLEIIFNAHGIPSRMTMGQIIEMLVGKICAYKGTHYDATIFKEFDMKAVADELEKYGFHKYGYEKVISGLTGEYIDSLIFVGPIFYQRLAKLVLDSEYIIKNPTTDAATRQPLDNAGINGGLRIGEMEEWCIAAHGAARICAEKFRDHSDGYIEQICQCGKEAIVNFREGLYVCKNCGDNANISAIPNTWSSKLLMHELQSINVGVRRIPRPSKREIMDDIDRTHSHIEEYNQHAINSVLKYSEELVELNAQADE
jgi:DNA-directed RNA polymerase beta subunit